MFMAADVSSLVRMLSGCSDKPGEVDGPDGRRDLITRDLLGGSGGGRSKELDLDLKVPVGWEKRLDLVSGEVFFQRSSSNSSAAAAAAGSSQTGSASAASRRFQDLNLPPQAPPASAQPSLDLRLFAPAPAAEYRSVCTLDKVKSALDRLAAASPTKKPAPPHHQHHHPFRGLHDGADPSSSPTSSSTTASSLKPRGRGDMVTGRMEEEGESRPPEQEAGGGAAAMVAAGCPSCLSYVLISRNSPRCPRCGSAVPLMPAPKKPRLDLNLNFRS